MSSNNNKKTTTQKYTSAGVNAEHEQHNKTQRRQEDHRRAQTRFVYDHPAHEAHPKHKSKRIVRTGFGHT